jgi:glutathione S-transferase
MIDLYQLQWSHFVEKVRWALDFKQLKWSAVNVNPFTKRELRQLRSKFPLEPGRRLYTVPTIYDGATDSVITESSVILRYLERQYPTPALYPADEAKRQEVERWMLWLDSTVGLAGRRLAYTHIALEHPGCLATLCMPKFRGANGNTLTGRIAGSVIAGLITRRYRCLYNREDRVFEKLEECLLLAARRLRSRRFLVGGSFTAADLTLASLLRPITVVPFFRAHPRLQRVFEWREALIHQHRRNVDVIYDTALKEVRERRGWALGNVSWLPALTRNEESALTEIPALEAAFNDQQSLGRWSTIRAPLWFLRLKMKNGLGRTFYPW